LKQLAIISYLINKYLSCHFVQILEILAQYIFPTLSKQSLRLHFRGGGGTAGLGRRKKGVINNRKKQKALEANNIYKVNFFSSYYTPDYLNMVEIP